MTRRRWGELSLVLIVTAFVGAVAGYSLGRHWNEQDITTAKANYADVQKTNIDLTTTNQAQAARIKALEDTVATYKAQVDDVYQLDRTIEVKSNESKIVWDGRFTIGVTGIPGSNSVDVNVNGQHKSMVAGDTANLTFNCRVQLVTFGVTTSSATFNTSCAVAAPQEQAPQK
jgi:hypothetical protein